MNLPRLPSAIIAKIFTYLDIVTFTSDPIFFILYMDSKYKLHDKSYISFEDKIIKSYSEDNDVSSFISNLNYHHIKRKFFNWDFKITVDGFIFVISYRLQRQDFDAYGIVYKFVMSGHNKLYDKYWDGSWNFAPLCNNQVKHMNRLFNLFKKLCRRTIFVGIDEMYAKLGYYMG